jgi:segregation and condensation protein B
MSDETDVEPTPPEDWAPEAPTEDDAATESPVDEPDAGDTGDEGGQITDADAKAAIEAVVMVADEPVDPKMLGELVELSAGQVEVLCRELAAEYEEQGRGFQLVRVAGGYRFQSHPDRAPWVERYVLDGQSARMSAAALETLAIVAYKQPVSRAQVAAIRGVGVDGVMRTLQQRGYIDEIGRDPGPGQAVLFGTTRVFLERLGLDSLAQLPSLGDFVPGADVVEALEHGLRAVPLQIDEALADDDAGPSDAEAVPVDDEAAASEVEAGPSDSEAGPPGPFG